MLERRSSQRGQFQLSLARGAVGLAGWPARRAAALRACRGVVAAAWLLSGCLADAGKCGKHQELNDFGNCACREGYRLDERLRCVACGEHEVSAGDRCDCAQGYTRSAQGACEPLPAGLGQPCSEEAPCLGTTAPYCLVEARVSAREPKGAGGRSYCTSTGCASSSDCGGGYACDLASEPSVCRAPPSGQGVSCQEAEDCAAFEASYCEIARSRVCLVPDCDPDGSDCFEGWTCCDLTEFGLPTLCVTEGSCPTS